ncbi:hypothetical protein [Bradyrhizobium cenepequi]|uniref:hypothetical protein n=1 Tax=Bradyrhizobium cenepequi TaxID=2821403 RepID=UPI001CE3B24F|nr:hypothetical protein [Bradyrhizobium cenepequi]MCA6108131.1 hypothetical protein [Bradyrhizobium cenepequi]
MIIATLETNFEFWAQQMNMRLRELEKARQSVPTDAAKGAIASLAASIQAPVVPPATEQPAPTQDAPAPVSEPSTPLPDMPSPIQAAAQPIQVKRMSKLSDLRDKIAASRKEREALTGNLMSQHEALDAEAKGVLAEVKTDLDNTKAEIEELKASLTPNTNGNGGPA